MKRLLGALALMATLGMAALTPSVAADVPTASAIKPEPIVLAQAAPAATAEPAKAEAAPAAAPAAKEEAKEAPAEAAAAPTPNKGDTAWMTVATVLVILMVLPGLALFYGGLVRSKNILSVLMQVMMVFSMIAVLWVVYGYTLAFGGPGAFFGSLDKLFLKGVTPDSVAATFSKGVVIPEYIFIAFQLTFAAITPALIVGAFAERIKFSAVLLFCLLWFTFSYLPIAHMVWYWDGPDAITDAKTLETVTANAGLLWAKGALDFAGGTVVHINAGIAGLVGAFMLGKRLGYGREAMAPHSLAFTMIGASLLWVGWFGFNAGSNLEANGVTALAFINTLVATGVVCLWGVNGLKRMLGADDALDVFGVHGLGGIVGALLTGVFAAPSLGGTGIFDYVANAANPEYSIGAQVWIQLQGVLITIVWSAIVSVIAFKVVDLLVGLRVPEDEEREGLDITSHGESAYRS